MVQALTSIRTGRIAAPAIAAVLGAAVTAPAVTWEPLHLDEAIMLEFSPLSLPSIVKDVFVDRGGAPAQFFVEHATLVWPGGIVGLRGPSLIFFILALPVAAAFARRLIGEGPALVLPFMLALAPLAVGLATFARMYALFLRRGMDRLAGRDPGERHSADAVFPCQRAVPGWNRRALPRTSRSALRP
jgi:hypothetical protein